MITCIFLFTGPLAELYMLGCIYEQLDFKKLDANSEYSYKP